MPADSFFEQILYLIKTEHPQIATVILFSQAYENAGKILNELPYNLAIELSERVYYIETISEDVKLLLAERLNSNDPCLFNSEKNGIAILINSLDYCTYIRKREIILGLRDLYDIKLEYEGYRIIEDIISAENDIIIQFLKFIDLNDLTKVLRIAPYEIKKRLFDLLPDDISSEIQSDLDWSGAVKIDDIADASERLLLVINDINNQKL